MKLSARQRKFLEIASREEGYCPWDPPPRAPILRNHEMIPLTDNSLVDFNDEGTTWVITAAGRLALSPPQSRTPEK